MNITKNILKLSIATLLLGALLSVASPNVAFASGDDTIDGCKDIKTSIIKCNTQGGNPVLSMVMQITNFLAIGVGIAVVGGIVWGATMYVSSNGDSAKTKQAITIIVNAVLGLLLFIFGWAILNALVPGGLLR